MLKLLLLLPFLSTLLFSQEKDEVGLQLSLIAKNTSIVPGEPFVAGVHIVHEPGYHTYWQSPGIVGLATQLKWHLPPGWSASPVLWPYPEQCNMAGHPCHGYERDVTLLTTITPPVKMESVPQTLKVSVTWMCCATGCYPGSKELSLTLPVSSKAEINTTSSGLIKTAQTEVPQISENWTAHFHSKTDGSQLTLTFTGPGREAPQYFFSSDGQISSDQKQIFQETAPGTWELSIARAEFSPSEKKSLPGVLKTPLGYSQINALPK